MSDADYRAQQALLLAQLDAAKLEDQAPDDVVPVVRELLELCLEQSDAAAARAAHAELERLSDLDDPACPVLLDYYASRIALADDDATGAIEAAERAITKAREHALDHDLPHLHDVLANALAKAERPLDAKKAREEAANQFSATDQHARAGLAWRALAIEAPFEEAPALFRRAVEAAERGDAPQITGVVFYTLGRWHLDRDEYLPARHALERALKIARENADPVGEAYALEHLAWLEVEAYHHKEGIALASEAFEKAQDDWQRARALDARANARHRSHEHLAARADLLRAAELFAAADDAEWAEDCRRRASGDKLLHYLHYLPTWVFRDRDMSSRAAAMKRPFQPLLLWLGLFLLLWTLGFTFGAVALRRPVLSIPMLILGILPLGTLMVTLHVALFRQWMRHRRAERQE